MKTEKPKPVYKFVLLNNLQEIKEILKSLEKTIDPKNINWKKEGF